MESHEAAAVLLAIAGIVGAPVAIWLIIAAIALMVGKKR
jgi:hypothetical protein